jgi:hypothetical protein
MQLSLSSEPFDRLQQLAVPALYCPFRSRISSHSDQVESANLEWLRRFGLMPTPGLAARLQRARFGRLAARAYPDASVEGLGIAAAWATWLFLRDDQCDENKIGLDPKALRALANEQIGVLVGLLQPRSDQPLTCALADLRERMIAKGGAGWMARFLSDVQDYFEASVWEADNRQRGRSPDLQTYVRLRDLTGAVKTCFDIHELTEGDPLSIDARHDDTLLQMMRLANRAICWSNDLFSVEKELEHGDFHNLVIVLQHHAGLGPRDAVLQAVRMHDDAVRSFERHEHQLTQNGVSHEVGCFVVALKGWVRANLDWSIETGRYASTATTHAASSIAALAPFVTEEETDRGRTQER